MASTVFDFSGLARPIANVIAEGEKAQGEGKRNVLVVGEKLTAEQSRYLHFYAAAYVDVPEVPLIFEDEAEIDEETGRATRHFLNADDFAELMGFVPTIAEAEAFIVEMSDLIAALVYQDGCRRARAKVAEDQRARELEDRRRAHEDAKKAELQAAWTAYRAKTRPGNRVNDSDGSQREAGI